MIPTEQALEARPENVVSKVLTELNRLVERPIAVTEISRLRCPEVEPEALLGAVSVYRARAGDIISINERALLNREEHPQANSLRIVQDSLVSEHIWRAQP